MPTWCLELVLAALTKALFEPIKTCRLKYLIWKTVFLVAVTSGRRASELHTLCCMQVTIHTVYQCWCDPLYEPAVPAEGLHQGQHVLAHLCTSNAQSITLGTMQVLRPPDDQCICETLR